MKTLYAWLEGLPVGVFRQWEGGRAESEYDSSDTNFPIPSARRILAAQCPFAVPG
ncbi:MAG: hypothetical protein LBJ08_07045 [Bifidobacteriaceae bacterium]|jgi:hypothetical protein|nr:hypothetical protein [Bifidobacteriaceae bacterium]